MITREEYNKALDVVEEYHKQLFINISNIQNEILTRTPILEWNKLDKCNQRLYNALRRLERQNKENGLDVFIENITEKSLKSIRNAGRKTWVDFKILRDGKL